MNVQELPMLLQAGLRQLKLDVSGETQEKILAYIVLLHKWNQTHNLISPSAPHTILVRHVLDGLTLVPFVRGPAILDFGTGAGLPGIPLAIVLSKYKFVLLDSVQKKTTFVQHVILTLGIKNVTVVTSRIEAFHFASTFATIVTRATTDAAEVIRQTSRFCKVRGQFLLMKGKDPKRELLAVTKQYTVERVVVPYLKEERHIIKIIN